MSRELLAVVAFLVVAWAAIAAVVVFVLAAAGVVHVG